MDSSEVFGVHPEIMGMHPNKRNKNIHFFINITSTVFSIPQVKTEKKRDFAKESRLNVVGAIYVEKIAILWYSMGMKRRDQYARSVAFDIAFPGKNLGRPLFSRRARIDGNQ